MYPVKLMPKAIKDMKTLPKTEARKIIEKIQGLENGLSGDIKKLTNFTPEYRLRVGNYRVLFEIDGQELIVYRVMHRKKVYFQR